MWALPYVLAQDSILQLMYDVIVRSGLIDTPMARQAPEEAVKLAIKETPLGRMGRPEGLSLALSSLLLHVHV